MPRDPEVGGLGLVFAGVCEYDLCGWMVWFDGVPVARSEIVPPELELLLAFGAYSEETLPASVVIKLGVSCPCHE